VRNPSYIAYKPISHSYIPEKQTTLWHDSNSLSFGPWSTWIMQTSLKRCNHSYMIAMEAPHCRCCWLADNFEYMKIQLISSFRFRFLTSSILQLGIGPIFCFCDAGFNLNASWISRIEPILCIILHQDI
jgi:hypothetical protein